jgi:NADPH:quinone reductase-like Zn-dependent oxidoreductase
MKAIDLKSYGDPRSSLRVIEVEEPPAPGPGDVLIGMEFAPINHTDLFFIQGVFSIRPQLPSPVGNEGGGRVIAVGEGVTNVKPGDRVVPPLYSLTWREKLIAKADQLFPLPDDVNVEQLAMLRIAPVTAALLLSETVALNRGDWIVQNAGTSAVGLSVSAIAKSRGFNVISLVRQETSIPNSLTTGADAAVVDDEAAFTKIGELTQGASVRLGLDAVGGAAAGRLSSLLSPGATLVGYGSLGGDLISQINVLDLIYKDVTYRGFYQGRPQYDQAIPAALRESIGLIASGHLKIPVAKVYPMEEIATAIQHTINGGKVLLKLSAQP